jgi:hypothetical protein
MPGAYTLEWKDGRKENFFGHRGYYYVFPDRTLLSFLPAPAWCHACREIRLCEHFSDEASLRKELADLSDPTSARSQELAKSSSPHFPEVWKRKREVEFRHALARRLPPSCLHCGQRRVAFFTEGEWASHPGTGEDVRFCCSGMCSTNFAMKFYDVDGNLLKTSAEERAALLESIRSGGDV